MIVSLCWPHVVPVSAFIMLSRCLHLVCVCVAWSLNVLSVSNRTPRILGHFVVDRDLWSVFGFVCVCCEECGGAFGYAEVEVVFCEVYLERVEVGVGVFFHGWYVGAVARGCHVICVLHEKGV